MRPPLVSRRAGLTHAQAVLLLAVFTTGWCCVSSGLAEQVLLRPRYRSSKTKCANNLRQLGLAAIQYADDKRFFPYAGAPGGLAGGVDSNATPKTIRTLSWYGYHDNPEGYICPQSYDVYAPITDDLVKADMKLWFWGGERRGDTERSPLVDGLPDPTLDEVGELSYGWTRRPLNSNARSRTLLGADRAQADPALRDAVLDAHVPPGALGNHDAGSNVVHVDGTVEWYAGGSEDAARLAGVEDRARDGFLAIRPPTRPGGSTTEGHGRRAEVALAWLVLLGPPCAVAGLLVRAVRRTPPPSGTIVVTPADAVVRVRPSRVEALGPDERLKLGLGAPPTARSPVVLQHQQRCPACHDVVKPDDALSRCLACRAVFHAECVAPGGDCPTLGCRAG